MNYLNFLENQINKVCVIQLEKELYSKSAILKTCYKFTDIAYIFIKTNNDGDTKLYTIYYRLKDESGNQDLTGDFMNELLDQELRAIVLKETQTVRDTIVTRALLSGQANEN